ncbi:hypothetical protein [Mycobacterium sp. 852002-51961_SCH5331710]|uniref:hypothetical protein n=1 Tax=Mycobacterium sp. 852002-51961_SCH5331710 TaxID=1834105 RepID=UPI0012E93071|nr:hypothetical protein [Mycobacterium sp. 852002-51961_SCH5331710]
MSFNMVHTGHADKWLFLLVAGNRRRWFNPSIAHHSLCSSDAYSENLNWTHAQNVPNERPSAVSLHREASACGCRNVDWTANFRLVLDRAHDNVQLRLIACAHATSPRRPVCVTGRLMGLFGDGSLKLSQSGKKIDSNFRHRVRCQESPCNQRWFACTAANDHGHLALGIRAAEPVSGSIRTIHERSDRLFL